MQVSFGESHKVVGGHPSLGNWDLGSAPQMQWNDGNIWTLEVQLPEGSDIEFKVCHLQYGVLHGDMHCLSRFSAHKLPLICRHICTSNLSTHLLSNYILHIIFVIFLMSCNQYLCIPRSSCVHRDHSSPQAAVCDRSV